MIFISLIWVNSFFRILLLGLSGIVVVACNLRRCGTARRYTNYRFGLSDFMDQLEIQVSYFLEG